MAVVDLNLNRNSLSHVNSRANSPCRALRVCPRAHTHASPSLSRLWLQLSSIIVASANLAHLMYAHSTHTHTRIAPHTNSRSTHTGYRITWLCYIFRYVHHIKGSSCVDLLAPHRCTAHFVRSLLLSLCISLAVRE